MTTAVREAPERAETKTKRWTLREVEKQTATLEDLRRQVTELAEKERTLSDQIASAIEAGEDPSDLREELEEARSLREDLEGVEPVLAERIEERRELACRALAEERLASIKKAIGGLRGELPRHLKRAEEAGEAYLEALRKATDARPRATYLVEEARALCRRFGLTMPELELPEGVDPALRKVDAPPRTRVPHTLHAKAPEDAVKIVARALERWGDGCPSVEILAEAGEPEEPWTPEAEQEAEKERQEAERQERRATVDEWLRGALEAGPRPRGEVRGAAVASDELRDAYPRSGWSSKEAVEVLSASRRRLEVEDVQRKADGARCWALPGTWSEEDFTRPRRR